MKTKIIHEGIKQILRHLFKKLELPEIALLEVSNWDLRYLGTVA